MPYYDKNERVVRAVLDGVITEYGSLSAAIPSRQFVGYAGMPLDCEMLSAFLVRMYQVEPGAGPSAEGVYSQRCVYWAGMEIDVVLMRCTPQPKVAAHTFKDVPLSAVEAFAVLQLRDPHIIQRGILRARDDGVLGEGSNLTFLDTAPLADESGALIGLRVRVRVGGAL